MPSSVNDPATPEPGTQALPYDAWRDQQDNEELLGFAKELFTSIQLAEAIVDTVEPNLKKKDRILAVVNMHDCMVNEWHTLRAHSQDEQTAENSRRTWKLVASAVPLLDKALHFAQLNSRRRAGPLRRLIQAVTYGWAHGRAHLFEPNEAAVGAETLRQALAEYMMSMGGMFMDQDPSAPPPTVPPYPDD